jgi:hypothetical protein
MKYLLPITFIVVLVVAGFISCLKERERASFIQNVEATSRLITCMEEMTECMENLQDRVTELEEKE